MEEQSYPQSIHLIRLIEACKRQQTADLIQAAHLDNARAITCLPCLASHTHIFVTTPPAHLRTQESILVEAAIEKVAVFPCGDDTDGLDTKTAWSTGNLTRQVLFGGVCIIILPTNRPS